VAANLFETLQQRRGRVLFVSEKNTRRSQVAEVFARVLGSDVMDAASAGDARALRAVNLAYFDVIVNMSACALPQTETLVLNLSAGTTPGDEDERIKAFVLFLAEHFRRAKEWRAGVERASVPDAPQTSPNPPPAAPPQRAAAKAAAS
jgi:hypothetical protein